MLFKKNIFDQLYRIECGISGGNGHVHSVRSHVLNVVAKEHSRGGGGKCVTVLRAKKSLRGFKL
jgi:hypothetical protein